MRGTHQLSAQRDESGDQDKLSKQGELTLCEYGRRGKLGRREPRKWESDEHSLPIECSGGDVRTLKENEKATATHSLSSAGEGQARSPKETKRTRGTHSLSSVERETSRVTERKQAIEGHSLPVAREGRGNSGHRKEPSGREILTSCRAWRA